MRIALINSGITYWLAGSPTQPDAEFSSVAELEVDPAITLQTVKPVRAVQGKVWDRGQILTTVRWKTTRKFPDLATAEKWLLDYESAFPRTGQLVFHIQLPGGGDAVRTMDNVVIEPPKRHQIGVSIDLTYTAHGGKMNPPPVS